MREQDGTQTSIKRQRNYQASKQAPALLRPTNDDKEAWKAYWQALNQPWRTEPEIDKIRQDELDERRKIRPDIENGIFPFKDIKLDRADIEWLLSTHENGRGPIFWHDDGQQGRLGLDMRGADLRGADLRYLPLARFHGGLLWIQRIKVNEEQRKMAAVLMQGAKLFRAHLETAILDDAHLEDADLEDAHLEFASLRGAHLDRAKLAFVHLGGAHLRKAYLQDSDLRDAYLENARLQDVTLGNAKRIGPLVADAQWENTNLAVVKWSQVKMLGDEYVARQKVQNGKMKDKDTRLQDFEASVRANRQLAIALQTQGLDEGAAYFAYRAQKLQRVVLRLQRKLITYFFSGFLDLLAGYGYKPTRSLFWYLVIIFGFAIAYFAFGHLPLLPDAIVFSLTSFHGRGFFPGLANETSLHNPLVVLAAIEAVIGLFIEISFIATFTKRFFGS